MSETVRASEKKSEAAKKERTSHVQKSNYSQPANSSFDHILFLQRTIGNQAVGRLIKSRMVGIQSVGTLLQGGLVQRDEKENEAPRAYTVRSSEIAASPRLASIAETGNNPLRQGQIDPAIQLFKELLADKLGSVFDKPPDATKDGDISKTYGPQTAAAVKRLQQIMDVPGPNGQAAGKQTMRAMDEFVAGGGQLGLASLDVNGQLPGSGARPLDMADLLHRLMVSGGAAATANQVVSSWAKEPAYWLYFVFNALRQNHRPDYDSLAAHASFQGAGRLVFIARVVVWPDLLLDPTQIPAGLLSGDDLGALTGVALSGMVYAPGGQMRAVWDDPVFGIPEKNESRVSGPQVAWMLYSIKQVRSQTRTNRGMDRRGPGWVYSAASNGGLLPAEVAATPQGSIERAIWEELGSEGSAASINTYDPGIVTWGTGYAAVGELPELMGRISPAILTELYRAGVAVGSPGKGGVESSFRYVDTTTGVVLAGREATSVLRNDPATLSIMLSAGEGHLQEMLDATWAQVKAKKLEPLDKNPKLKVVKGWPQHLVKFCVHAMHFAGVLTWDTFVTLGGNDGSNVRAIVAATLKQANYRTAKNGAHMAKPDIVKTASVPYDFGKQRGEVPTDPSGRKWGKEGSLLQAYVGAVEPLPEDAETNPDYAGTWFLPIDYQAPIPVKTGQNCRRFVDH